MNFFLVGDIIKIEGASYNIEFLAPINFTNNTNGDFKNIFIY